MVYDPTGRMRTFDPMSGGQLGSIGKAMPLTGINNPNQSLQNPPDFMSGGPHPMPNMPGQRPPDTTIFDPAPHLLGHGRPFDDVIGKEIKPGPGYFNDLVNKGGPPLSDEMRRKINEMVGARPPTKVPDMPDMPGDAGRGGEPTPPDFPSEPGLRPPGGDYSGFSGEPGSGRISASTTVFDRYDPATDTYYGSIGGFAGNIPTSVSGSEVGEEFKKAWAIANQGLTGPSPTPSGTRPPVILNIPDMPIPDIDDPLLPNPPPTGDPVPTAPETPATTGPLSPLDTLYGQIGVSDEAAARDVVNKILSGQTGDLTQAQRDLTGGGIYRRIANRLGMKDAAGNLITPFSSVQTESGNIVTPEAAQVFQSLLDMENLESGSGIELLLNHLRGRMRPRPPMPQPQPGPFGLIPGRGGFGMPGYGGMYGMPRPPMFGSPYMSRMPFMNYAGMANPMNRSIFGGYGYGYGPGMGMAPLSYYGGYNSPQRQMFG